MTSDEKRDEAGTRETDPAGAPDDAPAKAKEELFEAIEHFRNAANILFDRAAKDPTLRSATAEAQKVVHKLGTAAEPLAKQVTSELSKLTKKLSEAVDGRRKSERPPPDDAGSSGT